MIYYVAYIVQRWTEGTVLFERPAGVCLLLGLVCIVLCILYYTFLYVCLPLCLCLLFLLLCVCCHLANKS